MSPSPASRCGCWCRPWANGCARNMISLGAIAPARRALWSLPNMPTSTSLQFARCWGPDARRLSRKPRVEETETPFDMGQDPADLVVLSFSDSDLGAFAAGWHRAAGALPSVRLGNLVALKHPLSVDTYVENTLRHAKGILIRLIGGEQYWPYGLAQLQDLARRKGIALAILPADGREDARLDALSTLPVSTLRRLQALCDAGGA